MPIAEARPAEFDVSNETLAYVYEQAKHLHRDDPVRRAAFRKLSWRIKELRVVRIGNWIYVWSDIDGSWTRLPAKRSFAKKK